MASVSASVRLGINIANNSKLLGGFPTFLKRQSRRRQSSEARNVDNKLLYTEEHLQIKNSLKQLIEKELNPYVDEWEKAEDYPAHEVFKKLGDGGFLGVNKPVEYGGLGLDYSYSLAIAEELGTVRSGSLTSAIGVQVDMATPALAKFGSDQLRRQFLAPAISGDNICAVAISEPSAGSDVAAIRTRAEKQGGDYIINGSKMWITNGAHADWYCVLANTSEGGGHKNKSLIIVPTNTPGVTVARRIDKMGLRFSDTAEIFFDDVRVPQSNLVGEEGQGFIYQMLQFQEERLHAAAASIGGMMTAITETVEYTSNRMAFGKPVLANQVVHYRLAEMETEVEALRAMVYMAVGQYIEGEDVTKLASMCKLKAGRLSREIADGCLQYWGGMGYTNDVIISRIYRDSRVLSIAGGTDEIMLAIISKYMGTLPGKDGKYKAR